MRKALLGLAALAVGAVTCVAQQNVYSLNIVGYVNVPVTANQLTLVSVPLKPSNGDFNITNTIVLPDTADSANLFKWAGTAWSSTIPQWYAGLGWYPDMTIGQGESFFIKSPVAATVTFVGEVATGTNSYTIPSGLSFVANKVPVAEAFPGASVGNDQDNIYLWAGNAWSSTIWQYYAGLGWNAGGLTDDTNGPVLAIGSGAAYRNGGAALNFTRTFNVQ